jgi:hypothetical protein
VTYCPRCAGRLAGPPPTACARCGYQLREAREYAWLPLVDAPPLAFETMDRALGDVRTRLRTAV